MGQEFIIKSQTLEDKVNQLLPSQGGFQAGVDLSASTTIIPIVDLTESAEGSNVRPDIQTALSLNSITAFEISNTTTTIINTTGYFRIFGNVQLKADSGGVKSASLLLTDGTTSKNITKFTASASGGFTNIMNIFDFIVFLQAGDSLQGVTTDTGATLSGSTRQIADLAGNLINPT